MAGYGSARRGTTTKRSDFAVAFRLRAFWTVVTVAPVLPAARQFPQMAGVF